MQSKKRNSVSLANGEYLYLYDYNLVINTCIKDLFFEYGKAYELTVDDVDINEEIIRNKIEELSQLVFECSRNCNLRCKYCVYNDNYINQRSIAPLDMNFEIARKSIDYIFSIIGNRKEKKFTCGFYGGEPLSNIKTIKKIVEYIKQQNNDWKLLFNMTTNLTLLNESILDFIVENDFILLVSLDGDKSNHDAKRIFANGNGTHYTVMKNLDKIRKKNEAYYYEKVGLSTVYSYDLPLKNLHKFFNTTDLIKKLPVRFGVVDMYNTNYYEKYPYNVSEFKKNFKDMFLQIKEKIRKGEELTGYENYIYTTFTKIKDNLNKRKFNTLAGSCLFSNRVFVDVDGGFHICEKMNTTFNFGDVDHGFNWRKMEKIVREFTSLIKSHCMECEIRFLCSRCYVSFMGNGEFKWNPLFCKNQRESIISNLENYINWKEEKLIL